jgi:mRNA-degrading endonuclease toxin of MazEF toxin-antitoxin module
MKTAISVPDDVFDQAERAAKRLGLPRSELFARALQAFLATRAEQNITSSYDAAFGDAGNSDFDEFRREGTRSCTSGRGLNLQRALAVGNVKVSAKQSSLPQPSVVLVCQVMTVNKSLFEKQQGSLSSRVMSEVDRGLALALGLQGAGL